MVRVVVRIDEIRHFIADAVGKSDVVDGPLDIAADGGGCIEQDDAVARRHERTLVDPIGDSVEIPLDPPDVVALLADPGAERRPTDRKPFVGRRTALRHVPRASCQIGSSGARPWGHSPPLGHGNATA